MIPRRPEYLAASWPFPSQVYGDAQDCMVT
jgi:hypothetical protein